MSCIVEISYLDFAYGQNLVLKHIDLSVEMGSILGLIGPNGGGKTTLVKLLTGQLQPTRGTITIGGLLPRDAIRRGDVIGYLPQSPADPSNLPLSVRQVARLGLVGKTGLLRSYKRDDLDFVDDLLRRVGVAELGEVPIAGLSGGQLQRVLIARALAARPKILLLDEPTTGIDRAGQQRFIESIIELKRELNLTVIFVSHDLRVVSSISDRIACMNVTLHYHDVPQHMPAELALEMFSCDLAAFGLPHEHAHGEPSSKNP